MEGVLPVWFREAAGVRGRVDAKTRSPYATPPHIPPKFAAHRRPVLPLSPEELGADISADFQQTCPLRKTVRHLFRELHTEICPMIMRHAPEEPKCAPALFERMETCVRLLFHLLQGRARRVEARAIVVQELKQHAGACKAMLSHQLHSSAEKIDAAVAAAFGVNARGEQEDISKASTLDASSVVPAQLLWTAKELRAAAERIVSASDKTTSPAQSGGTLQVGGSSSSSARGGQPQKSSNEDGDELEAARKKLFAEYCSLQSAGGNKQDEDHAKAPRPSTQQQLPPYVYRRAGVSYLQAPFYSSGGEERHPETRDAQSVVSNLEQQLRAFVTTFTATFLQILGQPRGSLSARQKEDAALLGELSHYFYVDVDEFFPDEQLEDDAWFDDRVRLWQSVLATQKQVLRTCAYHGGRARSVARALNEAEVALQFGTVSAQLAPVGGGSSTTNYRGTAGDCSRSERLERLVAEKVPPLEKLEDFVARAERNIRAWTAAAEADEDVGDHNEPQVKAADDANKQGEKVRAAYSDTERLFVELNFVQTLLNTEFLAQVVQQLKTSATDKAGVDFELHAFRRFLRYLQYWRQPKYRVLLEHPRCLDMLELLVVEDCRLLHYWTKGAGSGSDAAAGVAGSSLVFEKEEGRAALEGSGAMARSFFNVLHKQICYAQAVTGEIVPALAGDDEITDAHPAPSASSASAAPSRLTHVNPRSLPKGVTLIADDNLEEQGASAIESGCYRLDLSEIKDQLAALPRDQEPKEQPILEAVKRVHEGATDLAIFKPQPLKTDKLNKMGTQHFSQPGQDLQHTWRRGDADNAGAPAVSQKPAAAASEKEKEQAAELSGEDSDEADSVFFRGKGSSVVGRNSKKDDRGDTELQEGSIRADAIKDSNLDVTQLATLVSDVLEIPSRFPKRARDEVPRLEKCVQQTASAKYNARRKRDEKLARIKAEQAAAKAASKGLPTKGAMPLLRTGGTQKVAFAAPGAALGKGTLILGAGGLPLRAPIFPGQQPPMVHPGGRPAFLPAAALWHAAASTAKGALGTIPLSRIPGANTQGQAAVPGKPAASTLIPSRVVITKGNKDEAAGSVGGAVPPAAPSASASATTGAQQAAPSQAGKAGSSAASTGGAAPAAAAKPKQAVKRFGASMYAPKLSAAPAVVPQQPMGIPPRLQLAPGGVPAAHFGGFQPGMQLPQHALLGGKGQQLPGPAAAPLPQHFGYAIPSPLPGQHVLGAPITGAHGGLQAASASLKRPAPAASSSSAGEMLQPQNHAAANYHGMHHREGQHREMNTSVPLREANSTENQLHEDVAFFARDHDNENDPDSQLKRRRTICSLTSLRRGGHLENCTAEACASECSSAGSNGRNVSSRSGSSCSVLSVCSSLGPPARGEVFYDTYKDIVQDAKDALDVMTAMAAAADAEQEGFSDGTAADACCPAFPEDDRACDTACAASTDQPPHVEFPSVLEA